MLTQETQKRISNLLETIAESERQVEIARQVLTEQENFDPLALFNKLCAGKSELQQPDIQDFLEIYSVRHLQSEIELLFFTYNLSRQDMQYTGFLKMILPSSNHFLRQLKVELIPHRRKQIDVTYEIEWALVRVLEKELQLYRAIEVQKQEIICRWDFKVSTAFKMIAGKSNVDEIDHGDILNFIESLNGSCTSDDILNILRRCDYDKNGKIGLLDLEISLTPFAISKATYFAQALQLQDRKKEKTSQKKKSYAQQAQEIHELNSSNRQTKSRSYSTQISKNGQQQLKINDDKYSRKRTNDVPSQQKRYTGYKDGIYQSIDTTPLKRENDRSFDISEKKAARIFIQDKSIDSSYIRENDYSKSLLINPVSHSLVNSTQKEKLKKSQEINKNYHEYESEVKRKQPERIAFQDYKQEIKNQIRNEILNKNFCKQNKSYVTDQPNSFGVPKMSYLYQENDEQLLRKSLAENQERLRVQDEVPKWGNNPSPIDNNFQRSPVLQKTNQSKTKENERTNKQIHINELENNYLQSSLEYPTNQFKRPQKEINNYSDNKIQQQDKQIRFEEQRKEFPVVSPVRTREQETLQDYFISEKSIVKKEDRRGQIPSNINKSSDLSTSQDLSYYLKNQQKEEQESFYQQKREIDDIVEERRLSIVERDRILRNKEDQERQQDLLKRQEQLEKTRKEFNELKNSQEIGRRSNYNSVLHQSQVLNHQSLGKTNTINEDEIEFRLREEFELKLREELKAQIMVERDLNKQIQVKNDLEERIKLTEKAIKLRELEEVQLNEIKVGKDSFYFRNRQNKVEEDQLQLSRSIRNNQEAESKQLKQKRQLEMEHLLQIELENKQRKEIEEAKNLAIIRQEENRKISREIEIQRQQQEELLNQERQQQYFREEIERKLKEDKLKQLEAQEKQLAALKEEKERKIQQENRKLEDEKRLRIEQEIHLKEQEKLIQEQQYKKLEEIKFKEAQIKRDRQKQEENKMMLLKQKMEEQQKLTKAELDELDASERRIEGILYQQQLLERRRASEFDEEKFRALKLKEIEEEERKRFEELENQFSQAKYNKQSPLKGQNVIYKSASLHSSDLETKLSQLIHQQIQHLADIENKKENLSMRADFNLKDLLKILSADSSGNVFEEEFLQFLTQAHASITQEYMRSLLFKNNSGSNKLKKQDIESLFRPASIDHTILLENREPLQILDFNQYSIETKDLISLLLKKQIEGQQSLELLKRELTAVKEFSLQGVFDILEDKINKGIITFDSLKRGAKQLNIFVIDKDLKVFMNLLNKEKSIVSFEEFAQYIFPIKQR